MGTRDLAPIVLAARCAVLVVAFAVQPARAIDDDLLDLVQRADEADHRTFLAAVSRADACTGERDFDCADAQLGKARKLARTTGDRTRLADAQERLQRGQERVAEEQRQREQQAEQERQQLARAEQEQRARDEDEASTNNTAAAFLKLAQLTASNYAAAKAAPAPRNALPLADLTGSARRQAAVSAKPPQGSRPAVNAMNPSSPSADKPPGGVASAPASPDPFAVMTQLAAGQQDGAKSQRGAAHSAELWNDNYSNTVVATRATTAYPAHETDIPGDVIATTMRSEADAMDRWGSQGARSARYSGCGACGVGSKITVIVDFGYVVDTHEYVRVK